MEEKKYVCDGEKQNRLDAYLSEETGFTRSRIKKLIDEGNALVNGKTEKASYKVRKNDEIALTIPQAEKLSVEAEDIPIDIIYQDSSIAVINKRQGMTVHAGNGNYKSTLVNALLYHLDSLSGINGVIRPGIVHRIDKDTSGLLVVAKNDEAHISLSKQLLNKTLGRTYIALLEGNLKTDSGEIETFIGRDEKNRTKMAVTSSGRRAVTDYKVLKRYVGYTLCEFKLKTGRTHQIRVHSKYLGHPIVGDPVYGYKNQAFKLQGQLLHAYKLELIHPVTQEKMTFTAPMPDYFENVLSKLKPL